MNSLVTNRPGMDSSARQKLAQRVAAAWATLRALAPYAAIELILPGGTVLAILCWLYRRRRVASASATTSGLAAVLFRWKLGATSA
jgi:hypothetical protein